MLAGILVVSAGLGVLLNSMPKKEDLGGCGLSDSRVGWMTVGAL